MRQRGPALPQSAQCPGIKRPCMVDVLGANASRAFYPMESVVSGVQLVTTRDRRRKFD